MTRARSLTHPRAGLALSAAVALTAVATPAAADEGRFDAQAFRPVAAPRDLVVIHKSEVIGHMSPTIGVFTDLGLDPLVLVDEITGQDVDAVSSRLTVTGLLGFGLELDFSDRFRVPMDFQLAVPFIARQTSGNLRLIGTEGEVDDSALGDVRASGRLSLIRRKDDVSRGFGLAIAGNINLPTGSVEAFTGDGVLTGGVTAIVDYRLGVGAIVTANAGVWLRPERELAGVRMGDMGSVGVAAEAYVIQRWGISVLGGAYGYPNLDKLPDSPRQIPSETFLGLRWQTKYGVTVTVGGSFGAACSFGTPAFRLFSGVTWQPSSSREQEEIDRILESRSADPDDDGVIGEADKCPQVPGPPENLGCPDTDSDNDQIVDRLDACPDLPQGQRGKDGCPVAFVQGNRIVILDKVHFATDSDVILDESMPVLEAVAEVLRLRPEIQRVRIEGHTDVRASNSYNLLLSQRRVDSVKKALAERGVAPERLDAQGWGYTRPLVDDGDCNQSDEELDAACVALTSKNRRVEFHIVEWAPDAKK
ncbi:OmpA family protein [Haliangium sp.]|uniref:OmpA family protein n=1 Tax=Haliangium sp. TaxID=2663208 RepID=UPI003D0A52EB